MKTVEIAAAELDAESCYRLMTSVIVPRPIALVSTRSIEGNHNLAPFSFFNGVSHTPPTLMFAIGPGESGRVKDTARNIESHPEFIVHVVSAEMLDGIVAASAPVPSDVDEFSLAGFGAAPGRKVSVQRVKESPVAMECRLLKTFSVGPPDQITKLVIGEVIHWHIHEAVLDPPYRVNGASLAAIGRMSAGEFCRTDRTFRHTTPDSGN